MLSECDLEQEAEHRRDCKGINCVQNALPDSLATLTIQKLSTAAEQETLWRHEVTRDGEQQMSYYRMIDPRTTLGELWAQIESALAFNLKLDLAPQLERLILNVSMYRKGSFLSNHYDDDQPGVGFIRKRAVVWYATSCSPSSGGCFVDGGEIPERRYAPQSNMLLHFQTPRKHRVEENLSSEVRLAVYGWVVVPELPFVASSPALVAKLNTHACFPKMPLIVVLDMPLKQAVHEKLCALANHKMWEQAPSFHLSRITFVQFFPIIIVASSVIALAEGALLLRIANARAGRHWQAHAARIDATVDSNPMLIAAHVIEEAKKHHLCHEGDLFKHMLAALE